MLDLDAVRRDVSAASHLAAATRKTLLCRLQRLTLEPSFPRGLSSKVIPAITSHAATRLALMNATLSITRLSEPFRRAVGSEQIRSLFKESEVLREIENERRARGELRATDIEWEKVLELKSRFPLGSEARLLFLLYTVFPPLRADFSPMKIVDDEEQADGDRSFNYLVRSTPLIVILNEYKTAGKYGQQRLQVDCAELAALIPNDQEWLFESGGRPVLATTLSKKVVRAFAKHTGMHVTINTLRRSFARHSMSLSQDEMVDAALTQGHSLSVHREYSRRGSVPDAATDAAAQTV